MSVLIKKRGDSLTKRRKETLIFMVASLAVVLVVAALYVNTKPALSATPSDGCLACHLDADVMEAMYEVPPPAAGPG